MQSASLSNREEVLRHGQRSAQKNRGCPRGFCDPGSKRRNDHRKGGRDPSGSRFVAYFRRALILDFAELCCQRVVNAVINFRVKLGDSFAAFSVCRRRGVSDFCRYNFSCNFNGFCSNCMIRHVVTSILLWDMYNIPQKLTKVKLKVAKRSRIHMQQDHYNYPTLEAAIKRKGIKKKAIAKVLGVDEATIWHKTRGGRSFTVEQALLIQKTWFPEVPIDVLFKRGD
nr:MAG TPA: transcriptional regulator [Caudoviricetes sp.]